MSDLLPPGDTPWPAPTDQARDLADILQNETWASLWPRLIHHYVTTAARDADLAGLGSTNRAFAFVDALGCVTTWNGSAWTGYAPTSRRYEGTAATYAVTPADTVIPVTTWSTLRFNVGDIAYSAGIFTAGSAGKYRWDATVNWPATGTTYRVEQFVLINGAASWAGGASMNFYAGDGQQWLTSGFTVDLAAGGTLQLALECSTSGLTNVQPIAFCLTRVA